MGLISAASAAPIAVEAAAATLRDVLLGRTASAAKKTLRDATITLGALDAVKEGEGPRVIPSPTGAIAEALHGWKNTTGCMKVTDFSC